MPPPAPFKPRPGHDDFAAALVQLLSRPVREGSAWGPLRTVLWAVPTFGLVPALVWPGQFKQFVAAEREQFTGFAEWVRRNSIHPEAAVLVRAAARIGAGSFLGDLSIVLCGLTTIAFALLGTHLLTFHHVLYSTYLWFSIPTVLRPHAAPFVAWTVGLVAAYLCQALAVFAHVFDVRRFVASFNRLAAAEGLRPVDSPRVSPPQCARAATPVRAMMRFLGERWLVAAAVLLFPLKAAWGVGAAIAGAALKHYMLGTDPPLRAALAERITEMVLLRRAADTAARQRVFGRCQRAGCGAPLAAESRFCSRCGAAVPDRLAARV
jgi:hypothetical protein